MDIAQEIIHWNEQTPRNLPWEKIKNPYHIWLSEIILQQTRVVQGISYYHKFIDLFPTIIDLANAKEDTVMKAWEGLGYYSRARNLHHTAKAIRDQYNGEFPTHYKEILELKGVGPYTAAAIASFAFDLQHIAVDGNVSRVIARIFGITEGIDLTPTKKAIQAKAEYLCGSNTAKLFNQAIINFGAIHCTPKKPMCNLCPINQKCIAYRNGLVEVIPQKVKKIKRTKRYFTFYLLLDDLGQVLVQKRTDKDIWQGLYQLPLSESIQLENQFSKSILSDLGVELQEVKSVESVELDKHVLTHQDLFSRLYIIRCLSHDAESMETISLKAVGDYSFPRLLNRYFEKIEINNLYE